MNYYKKDVFISDIDSYFFISPKNIINKIRSNKYDMALFFNKKNSLPWERFAAGTSFFKYKNINSYRFLKDMNSYINIAKNNKNEVLWGAETVAMYYAYYKNIKKNQNIFDFSKILKLDNLILKVPKILQFKKKIFKTSGSIMNYNKFYFINFIISKIYKKH